MLESKVEGILYINNFRGMEQFLFKTKEFLEAVYTRFGFTETRPMTQFVGGTCKGNLIGVEIGTFKGENAKNILGRLKIKTLYLVDPYIKYSEYHDFEYRDIDDNLFSEAKRMVRKYKNNVEFIRKFSSDAISDIPDNLDFVYIDGNHDYKFVKKDIELYYPKVKPGGVIGGHNFDIVFNDVCKAVIEFAEKNNLEMQGFEDDWWVVKPSLRKNNA